MAKEGDAASIQDLETATQQASSDLNHKFTEPTLADQILDDISIKSSNPGLVIEPFATVTTSVAKAGGADTKNACGKDINAVRMLRKMNLELLILFYACNNIFIIFFSII